MDFFNLYFSDGVFKIFLAKFSLVSCCLKEKLFTSIQQDSPTILIKFSNVFKLLNLHFALNITMVNYIYYSRADHEIC